MARVQGRIGKVRRRHDVDDSQFRRPGMSEEQFRAEMADLVAKGIVETRIDENGERQYRLTEKGVQFAEEALGCKPKGKPI